MQDAPNYLRHLHPLAPTGKHLSVNLASVDLYRGSNRSPSYTNARAMLAQSRSVTPTLRATACQCTRTFSSISSMICEASSPREQKSRALRHQVRDVRIAAEITDREGEIAPGDNGVQFDYQYVAPD
jgi:hypothetical protein